MGIQLWTVRKELEADPQGTLNRLVEIGFAGVETAFFSGRFNLIDASRLFKELNLPDCAAHCELPFEDQRKTFLEFRRERIVRQQENRNVAGIEALDIKTLMGASPPRTR